jgi:hypothetical protein
LREALALFTEMDHQFRIPEIIERLAEWTWRTNARRDNKKSVKPVRWMACAIARLEATGHIQPPLEIARRARIRSELETELGEKEVARAWAEGEQLSVEDALEEIYRALPLSAG